MKLTLILLVAQVIYTRTADASYVCTNKKDFQTCLGAADLAAVGTAEGQIKTGSQQVKLLTSNAEDIPTYIAAVNGKCTNTYKPSYQTVVKYLKCTDKFVENCPTETKNLGLPKDGNDIAAVIDYECVNEKTLTQENACLTKINAELKKCQVPANTVTCSKIKTSLTCLKTAVDSGCPKLKAIDPFQMERNLELFDALNNVECSGAGRACAISIVTIIAMAVLAILNQKS